MTIKNYDTSISKWYNLTQNTYGFYKYTKILNMYAARFSKHPGFLTILISNLILNKKNGYVKI